MLFDVEAITCAQCSDSIERAILSRDPSATVTVQMVDKRVRVEGLLSEQQALDALAAAGYPASSATAHSDAGSECCGGCS